MKVVITAATEKEIAAIKDATNPLYISESGRLKLSFHISGVGLLASTFSIAKVIYEQKPDFIIQVGIAGTFNSAEALSKVVAVKEERLADTGVEEDGVFKDIFDLNLAGPNDFPFANGGLMNPHLQQYNFLQLDEVFGITINEITTRQQRIEQLKVKYNAAIESMEGAALHYCCFQTNTPFLQIRAISNYIGERDKSKWKFKESFDNLSSIIQRYLDHLYNVK